MSTSSNALDWIPNRYPPAGRSGHVDVYQTKSRGSVFVPDPYQWLESDSAETEDWVSAQHDLTREYLDKIPDVPRLRSAFKDCSDYERFTYPGLSWDDRWYWSYNSGLDPRGSLYRSRDKNLPDFFNTKDTDFELYFDANALSADGTVSLTDYSISRCGQYFAYAISDSGSDYQTIYVRPIDSPFIKGIDHEDDPGRLGDSVRFAKYTDISWLPDSSGFFYQRFREPSKDGTDPQEDPAMLCFHRLGAQQSEDIIVLEDDRQLNHYYGATVSEDGKYLSLTVYQGSSEINMLWVADLSDINLGAKIKWIKVVDKFVADYNVITNVGHIFYMLTDDSAPRYKIVTVDLGDPSGYSFKDLIPMSDDAIITDAKRVAGDKLVVKYTRNVIDEIYIHSLRGEKLTRIAGDFLGSAEISSSGQEEPWAFVTMSGFTTPDTIGLYDFSAPAENRWSIYRTTRLNGIDSNEFETKQVWYNSRDGTSVPMFIVRHISTPLDGTAPAIQYGYGGFNISINPFFSATILTLVKNYGFVYAVPNIRGGGEFGRVWHFAGRREYKSNSFDDFIAATEFLVKNNYADPKKVAITGGSNGGLLVAACVNRAPEGTFGCAVADVGVLDLFKFHKHTIGKAWISDYGDPDDPGDFDFIYPISPLHNIPKGQVLPPFLLITADHDDRVVPMHSFKMAATLQHMAADNPHPLLVRVEKKAGHDSRSTQQDISESADQYAFIVQSLGLVWKGE